ncbi:MAG TPA: YraN family protein [Polyangiaceae bacterium]
MERKAIGNRAEDAVARHLEARGFDVRFRNLRLGYLEIDLVATKDDLCVMVEVRSRGKNAYEKPLASLTSTKKKMYLLNAADRLWRRYVSKTNMRLRIDVAGVTFDGNTTLIDYVEGALTR